MSDDSTFYLGRVVTPADGQVTPTPYQYDPDDLTTHAVVVGMTGSGKTGLCMDLIEEAALQRLPVIMIDPKGDITNALLAFPELRPSDFQPWINPDVARREGKTVEEAATSTAETWRKGLGDWGITPDRIARMRDSVQRVIYTPGSDSGVPVNILASFSAPAIPWAENQESLREEISSTVTAILGLVGLTDIDPVRSREHILLSTIFETAWSQGKDLTLEELILQTQTPPFQKLGVFDVSTFFPDRDRSALAMSLNSILASPAFQTWITGDPLDIERMLYSADGTPRHSIFYVAHLSEAERMFFITLLLSAVDGWMRTKSGTSSLRALLYFDEIFGYLPPTAAPPAKEPMLRLLKQARAFGVGLLLATQNPVDVDYKALSNAGTWFIGKLGTEQDKTRLMDGLTSAAGAGLPRADYDRLISGLGKRVFLARNVHDREPTLFQTRWAMSYLAGPMTRAQIPALNALAGAKPTAAVASPAAPAETPLAAPAAPTRAAPAVELPGTQTPPKVPTRVEEYFLPDSLSLRDVQQDSRLPYGSELVTLLYRPLLLARADVRVVQRKYDLDSSKSFAVLVDQPDPRGRVRWEDHLVGPLDSRDLARRVADDARYSSLDAPLNDATTLKELQGDFADWVLNQGEIEIRANESLKLYAAPDESEADFAARCTRAAGEQARAEAEKLAASYDRKIETLTRKLEREQRELSDDQARYSARQREEAGSALGNVFDFFRGRRRSSMISSTMTKRRLSEDAKRDVQESEEEITSLTREIEKLEQEESDELAALQRRWEDVAAERTTVTVQPYKKDVSVTLFGVAWAPYYVMRSGEDQFQVPAFRVERAEQ